MGRFKSPGRVQREQCAQVVADASRKKVRRMVAYGVAGIAAGLLLLPVAKRGIHEVARLYAEHHVAGLRQGTITYDDARRHPTLRQQFINQILGTNQIPHCSGVVYDHDGNVMQDYYVRVGATDFVQKVDASKGGDYDMKTPNVLNRMGNGESVPILVGRKPFEDPSFAYMTAEDLRHVLIAHEGHHCTQHARGTFTLSPQEILAGLNERSIHPTFFYFVAEQDAYVHDLPRLLRGEFKGSEYHINDSKRKFMDNSLNLTKASRIARPLELRLLQGVHEAIAQEPLLQDLSVPSSYYEQKKRFK
ncbi:hypothetical protein EXS73_02705 [Candidatus Pacearchaeota archaeon]|nr:hypothetical protein [Candidatus Pacearchaeota archaeon]